MAFNDGHVEISTRPTVGQNNDNIFGNNTDPTEIGPLAHQVPIAAGRLPHPLQGEQGAMDVVMVPMRDAQGHLK